MFKHIMLRNPEALVEPSYQEQLDTLSEDLRVLHMGGVATQTELEQSQVEFDKVFVGNYLRGNQSDRLFDVDL